MQLVDDGEIKETFPNKRLLAITISFPAPWFVDIVNYIIEKKKLISDVKHYLWDDPYLFKVCGAIW
ncbi:hypothetical protein CR513_00843, partial [Mucuna pruriens]